MATTEVPAMAANSILFKDLCSALELVQKRKKNKHEQETVLIKFFNDCRSKIASVTGTKSSSFFPILRLILPECERERSPYNLKQNKLSKLLVKVLSLNEKSRDAEKLLNYRGVNHSEASNTDFAEVAYFVLKSRVAGSDANLTIGDVNCILDKIATAEVGNKGPALDEAFTFALRKLPAQQMKWLLRMVLKDMKLGAGSQRLLASFHPDAPDYYQRCGDLAKVCEELEDGSRAVELGVKLFFAYSPMLAERLDVTRVTSQLAPDRTYQLELKLDGERFQLHMENGKFEYFSRRGYRYAGVYGAGTGAGEGGEAGALTPRLRRALGAGVSSCILDGEMMGWHKQRQTFGSKGMAFDIKKITEKSSFQPCFCVFDVLMYNGRSLVGPAAEAGAPLRARREILDSMLEDVPGVIMKSKRRDITDRSEILSALNQAMEDDEEGLVVKDVDSYYLPNRRNGGWYKIKPEYTASTMTDLDLVITGVDEAGESSRGRARSFYVACADQISPDAAEVRWVCVGRVSSGLEHAVRAALGEALRPRWQASARAPPPPELVFNRRKPDYWILPEHSTVLQVRATELVRSGEFGASHALRFPRLVRLRDDKPPRHVLTLDEFNRLVQDKGPVAKLSRSLVSAEQMEAEAAPRKRRKTAEPAVPSHLRAAPSGEVCVTSRALSGRELCVLSAEEGGGGADDLAALVLQHGGKHVANPGPRTWCCVAGKMNVRVKSIMKCQSYDVVGAAWLRALPTSTTCCELRPLDMICITKETRLKMSLHFDQFGDSYTELLDVATLKRVFDNMDRKENPKIYLTKEEMLEVDQELFDGANPESFLRGCYIHFQQHSILEIRARKSGAAICGADHPNLTHVVCDTSQALLPYTTTATVVLDTWIERCLVEKRIVNTDDYL